MRILILSKPRWLILGAVVDVLVATATLLLEDKSPLMQAKIARLRVGMTKAEVEAILGPPSYNMDRYLPQAMRKKWKWAPCDNYTRSRPLVGEEWLLMIWYEPGDAAKKWVPPRKDGSREVRPDQRVADWELAIGLDQDPLLHRLADRIGRDKEPGLTRVLDTLADLLEWRAQLATGR
jgi:hypothetical protein